MNYRQVVRHIKQIFHDCGDPVRFTPTSRKMLDQTKTTGQMAVEVMKIDLQRTNEDSSLVISCPS